MGKPTMNEMSKRDLVSEVQKSSKNLEFTTTALTDDYAEPASTRQFIADFFRTDIMNHCEFLKQMNRFEGDDCYLIAEICERLCDQTEGKEAQKITPFYGVDDDDVVEAGDVGHIARADFQTHKSFPRNCFNIMMVYEAIKGLDGHEYNVYELAYLNYQSKGVFYVACLIFAIQSVLFWVVLNDNLQNFDVAVNQKDSQYTGASAFTRAANGVIGSYLVNEDDLVIQIPGNRDPFQPQLMRLMNRIVNQYALSFVPFINFYFLLLSDNAMDALLNGFSLLFIFELDDYILPLFAGIDIEDKLVINAHDFIMVPPNVDYLKCKRIEKSDPLPASNVKLYVSVNEEKKMINIYHRESATKYNKTSYVFSGFQSSKFLSLCEDSLDCVQHFKDIHD